MPTAFLFHLCRWLSLGYDLPHIPPSDKARGGAWFRFWSLRKRRR